jgi:hypothetical protein
MQRQELIDALETVKPGLAQKEIVEQSSSFAFIDGKVVTYNDEISISHPVEGLKVEGAVRAEELYQLLHRITRDEVEISQTKTNSTLRPGVRRLELLYRQK